MEVVGGERGLVTGSGSISPGILYISYDGMLEPLGQSQVLSYLERLAPGRRVYLISFEKAADWRDAAKLDAARRRIDHAGIHWHPLRYHKAPSAPATAFDIAQGTATALAVARRYRLGIVHARSYIPGLIALAVKRATGARFLFDMRGLWADERVDGGLWPAGGRLYRAAKRLERSLLASADHIVTLTEASVPELRLIVGPDARLAPVSVIPTCTDLERFHVPSERRARPFVLGYVGSVGTWYLLDEMLAVFVAVRRRIPDARLLIVNRGEHDLIRARLGAAGIDDAAVELLAATHDQVAAQIGRMNAAMALIKPAYSKIASAPTKLGEYLGCGVPCLGNVNVGDMASILEGERVGIAMRDLSRREIGEAADGLIALAREPEIARRCRETAERLFSLTRGVEAYDEIYSSFARGR